MREIYSNAIRAKEPTIAFELRNGRGRFLFMMFFSEDDEESRDALFVFLLRTKAGTRCRTLSGNLRALNLGFVSAKDSLS